MAKRSSKRKTAGCDPLEHRNHLCYLIAHRRIGKAASLVGDGRYICIPCGRAAADAESLCEPVEREQPPQ